MNNFLPEVLQGLHSQPKYLQSKYFYDKKGDELFQKIMACEEYYLTNAEMDIFQNQSAQIAATLLSGANQIDVVEFGPGDATKSVHLLQELAGRNGLANYYPIDISRNIIRLLSDTLPEIVPAIKIHGLAGEYFEMLEQVEKNNGHKKVILFLGANIGNFKFDQAGTFCRHLHNHLHPGDLVIIGFDLKKDPKKILAAYNDRQGFTRQFNLNLLNRINNELGANFDTGEFEHYPCYDPATGACKSYLISKKQQTISVAGNAIFFAAYEPIFMEISQKYSTVQIDQLAVDCGFKVLKTFFDQNRFFADVILEA